MAACVFGVALRIAAVEDVFGRNLDQGRIPLGGGAGQDARPVGVDGLAARPVAFSAVDIGVGGAVDDRADRCFVEQRGDGGGIADVEPADPVFLADISENEFRTSGRQQPELRAELPEGACDQYFLHCKNFMQRYKIKEVSL